jgi:hypothetical protein
MIDNIGKYLSEVIEAVYGDRLKNFISRNPADQWFIASDYVIGDKNRPHNVLCYEAHPVVPGSSTYRGGGPNLKRGWVSSFRVP